MLTITLKPGKERSLLRRHPWVFPTAIDRGQAGRKVEGRRHRAGAIV
jgi:23S rRNA (cytosine1962-C5)-methyltransferase